MYFFFFYIDGFSLQNLTKAEKVLNL